MHNFVTCLQYRTFNVQSCHKMLCVCIFSCIFCEFFINSFTSKMHDIGQTVFINWNSVTSLNISQVHQPQKMQNKELVSNFSRAHSQSLDSNEGTLPTKCGIPLTVTGHSECVQIFLILRLPMNHECLAISGNSQFAHRARA